MDSSLSLPSGTDASQVKQSIDNTLSQGNTIGGLEVVSSTSTVIGPPPPPLPPPNPPTTTSADLGLILGLSLPLLLILLSLVLICKFKSQEPTEDSFSGSTESDLVSSSKT